MAPAIWMRSSQVDGFEIVPAESGMTAGKLAGLLGAGQPLTSHILTGKRILTTAHMRKLGEYLKIAPGYFF